VHPRLLFCLSAVGRGERRTMAFLPGSPAGLQDRGRAWLGRELRPETRDPQALRWGHKAVPGAVLLVPRTLQVNWTWHTVAEPARCAPMTSAVLPLG